MNATPSKQPTSSTHWANLIEAGSGFGIRLFLVFYKLLGESICRLFAWPVAAYYYLRLKSARAASNEYLTQIHQQYPDVMPAGPRVIDGIRHFAHFAMAIVDKAVVWSKQLPEHQVDILDRKAFDEIISTPGGKLIIGSHFGNLEYCRGFSRQHQNIVINVLIHDLHALRFAEFMKKINPDSRLKLFQVTEIDVAMILKLQEAIGRGEWVVIAGDRVPITGDARTTEVVFLGRSAKLPIGPYILASTLRCPVYLLFAYRVRGRLCVSFEKFSNRVVIERSKRMEQIGQFAARFAARLEFHCRAAPFEWFNFYSFWNQDIGRQDVGGQGVGGQDVGIVKNSP